jgi:hypothetical protein
MSSPNTHGDKATINGVECVRVLLMHDIVQNDNNRPCTYCPEEPRKNIKPCSISCGNRFVWIDKISYVTLMLEA